jgi:hypothetical protein
LFGTFLLRERTPEVTKSAKNRAEQMFSASQKKTDQFLKQKEKAWQAGSEKTERLRALRLAKEKAENKATQGITDAPAKDRPKSTS